MSASSAAYSLKGAKSVATSRQCNDRYSSSHQSCRRSGDAALGRTDGAHGCRAGLWRHSQEKAASRNRQPGRCRDRGISSGDRAAERDSRRVDHLRLCRQWLCDRNHRDFGTSRCGFRLRLRRPAAAARSVSACAPSSIGRNDCVPGDRGTRMAASRTDHVRARSSASLAQADRSGIRAAERQRSFTDHHQLPLAGLDHGIPAGGACCLAVSFQRRHDPSLCLAGRPWSRPGRSGGADGSWREFRGSGDCRRSDAG